MRYFLLDTNIFIRYFIQDVPAQYEEARSILKDIEQSQTVGYLSVLVVNEVLWILENYYGMKRKEYIPPFLRLLLLKNIKVKEIKKELLISILKKILGTSLDFTDIYLFFTADKEEVKTFDKKLQRMKK